MNGNLRKRKSSKAGQVVIENQKIKKVGRSDHFIRPNHFGDANC